MALRIATRAGGMLLDGRVGSVRGKSNANDVVTDLDLASERVLVGEITSVRPRDAVVGEEGARVAGDSGIAWVIDPLDGTVNFVYGVPAWCVSVGVRGPGGRVAGAVVAPAMGESWVAWAAGGAWRLPYEPVADVSAVRTVGERLHVSAVGDLGAALIGTGFGYDPAMRAVQGEVVARLLPRARDIRRFGSAALDLCAVASARLDGYYERGLNEWDIAAGALIVAEAGGSVTEGEGGFIVAAAPGISTELTAAVG